MGGDDEQPELENSATADEVTPTVPVMKTVETIEEFDASLPDTVALLRGPNNSKLYLIGTAHFSLQSHEDVSKVIRTVKPHIVVVELCANRAGFLTMDVKKLEEDSKNMSLERMLEIIRSEGTLPGLMTILFMYMSAKLTKELGMAPGGEFRRAFLECKALQPTPMFHFGDRSIQVTLRRALDVLSWWERTRLFCSLLFQDTDISKEYIEKCKQGDILESLLKDLEKEFPAIGEVFIQERDTYLTYSMQMACNTLFENVKEELVPTVAVGVVGIGHLPGIKSLWGTVQDHQIPPLLSVKQDSRKWRIFRRVLFGGVATYVAFKIVRRLPIDFQKLGLKF